MEISRQSSSQQELQETETENCKTADFRTYTHLSNTLLSWLVLGLINQKYTLPTRSALKILLVIQTII